ncbi:MAG: FAD-binding oxidoreductase [Pseudomonadota bacterium]
MTTTPSGRPPTTDGRTWYEATAEPAPRWPPLSGAARADVVVVGGGLTGLSAALHLAEAGRDVVVLEASRVGAGASGRNGGQLVTGQRRDQDELEAALGKPLAARLFDLAELAKVLVHDLAARHAIAYDYRPGLLHVAHRRRFLGEMQDYVLKLRDAYGYTQLSYLDRDALHALLASPGYHGATLDTGAGHLHPLAFVRGLASAAAAAGARIAEQTAALAVEERGAAAVRVRTASGHVDADHLILALNAGGEAVHPGLLGRIMPIDNYVVVTEPLGADGARALIGNGAAVSDSRFVINYFRCTSDHRLLFGGGETYGQRRARDVAQIVRPHLQAVFPQMQGVRIDYGWSGTVAITRRRLPWFGRLAPRTLVAGGYSGQGLAIATLAGKLMAEAVEGASDGFDTFAAIPHARFPGGRWARWPILALAMTWFGLRDRL